ncbi:MAG TPA: tetratricopeptide repeat protein [Pyrinomonadaceae bacterium]|nr:tetratricopeptide repeat protein [Pyrinomonadaceae bacterium]
MAGTEPTIFTFGGYSIDGTKRLLLDGEGEVVQLTPKVFDLLFYLVQRSGETVDKDRLMADIWPDTIVEENNLSQNISILRKVLGEKRGEHRYIATVPGVGYKFVAEVVPKDVARVVDDTPTPTPADVEPKWRPVFVTLLILVCLGLTASYYFWRNAPESIASLRSVAVLPFKPIAAQDRDEALEIGMADTLISRLGSIREIHVRPLTSVRRFGGPEQDALEAGRVLGVDAVLDGSIQHAGDKIRVNVTLVRVADGSAIWNEIYDEPFTDIFTVQDLIAKRVADSLKIRLANGSTLAEKGQTKNPDAYRLYLQGRLYWQKLTQPDVRRGIQFFQQAIDADPAYALAYAGMGDAYRSLPVNSDVPAADAMPQAKAAALKALELEPDLSYAHTVLGWIDYWYDHDWIGAEKEFQRALELSPNDPDAHRGYSTLLTCLGRHDEAIAEMATARDLDPLSLVTNSLEGQALFFAGRYDDAIDRLNKTLEIEPNFWVAHVMLARVYIQRKKYDLAISEAEKARRFSNDHSEPISLEGFAKAKSDHVDEAMQDLETLKSMQAQGLAADYNAAMLYNGLGKTDEAVAALEKAFDAKDVRLILLRVDPKWNNLRSDPRFIDIIKRMNFY